MNSILSIGLSGMKAAQAQLGAAAHNIANLQTTPYRRQLASTEAQAQGGVSVSLSQASQPGEDLVADLVNQRQALYAFKANLRTVQTADAMMGALLNTFA